MDHSNSFLSPYEILPIGPENKNLGKCFDFIMKSKYFHEEFYNKNQESHSQTSYPGSVSWSVPAATHRESTDTSE